ncbi:hypothetical protein CPAV1605_393 [seawater metagenome]|uniref:Uncharacterized protein n=1 Tax=seawater metagenome TaxID=1561972 RepID=A0A5E8CGW9_9ZZZZ
MSFYTNRMPRLIEPHIAKKLMILNKPPEKKPMINYKKINNCVLSYLSRNWSFICIISILAVLLIYRYKINKSENEMKKARKSYMDKLIMDNYINELELEDIQQQPQLDSIPIPTPLQVQNQENDEIVQETILESPPTENLTFDQLFTHNLDYTFSGFEGNSSFAPF